MILCCLKWIVYQNTCQVHSSIASIHKSPPGHSYGNTHYTLPLRIQRMGILLA